MGNIGLLRRRRATGIGQVLALLLLLGSAVTAASKVTDLAYLCTISSPTPPRDVALTLDAAWSYTSNILCARRPQLVKKALILLVVLFLSLSLSMCVGCGGNGDNNGDANQEDGATQDDGAEEDDAGEPKEDDATGPEEDDADKPDEDGANEPHENDPDGEDTDSEDEDTDDTTPPVISDLAVSDITATSARITWTTDEPASSQVEYGRTADYGSSSGLDTQLNTSHELTLTELESGAIYHYGVKCTDDSDNEVLSGDNTFTTLAHVLYAGVRSSIYGVRPFPEPAIWEAKIRCMADAFPGSTPTAIWIVGTTDEDVDGVHLEFPSDGNTYPHITFADTDRHEEYLAYFDAHGIRVFLQVEPGHADVATVIDLVLRRYGHHPAVLGFGVDVEWYQNVTDGQEGTPVSDALAEAWENQVKAHQAEYELFLKHWDVAFMPPTYRGSIIFVDDSQGFGSLDAFLREMGDWAETFYPNPVMFQYGYPSDQPWWGQMNSPPQTVGDALAQQTEQACGVFWVDFSLYTISLSEVE